MTVVIDGTLGISPVTASGTSASVDGMTVGKGGGEVSTNTAVGKTALTTNSTGADNTAGGWQAMYNNTTGSSNTAFGSNALVNNTTATGNSAFGYQSLQNNTTGTYSSAFGYQSGLLNTTGEIAAFGTWSLKNNTAGTRNVSLGDYSLQANTTANDNNAVGFYALTANTTGANNTGIGSYALTSNTTASYNTAIGYQAGYTATTNISNCFIGAKAGYAATGANNTYVGANNSGGNGSGSAMTSGNSNTILGGFTGNQGGLDIRTSSNYIVLSDGDGNPRGYYNGTGNYWAFNNGGASGSTVANFSNDNASNPYGIYVAFTAAAPNNTSNYVFRGQDNSTSMYTIWSNGTTSGRSDARLKKNISDATPKLDDICKLQVRNYEWTTSDGGSKEIGLIAQEVETVFPNLVITHDVEKDGDDYKEVKYSVFVPMLLKAVQELKTIVDAQAAEIAELKAKVG